MIGEGICSSPLATRLESDEISDHRRVPGRDVYRRIYPWLNSGDSALVKWVQPAIRNEYIRGLVGS